MAQFTTRVELHGAVERDYTTLHSAMANEGFTRSIVADDGSKYWLPTAEYDYRGDKTRVEILSKAERAAKTTGKPYEVLVTESAGRTWTNLKPAK